MMENRLKQTVKAFSDIIEAIEELEIVERETVSKIRAKRRLVGVVGGQAFLIVVIAGQG